MEPDKGAFTLRRGDAVWTPIACPIHADEQIVRHGDQEENIGGDGSGYQPTCAGCQATARETIAHIKAVEANA